MNVLAGLHPFLIEHITRILSAMATLGFPMKPIQGLRTLAQQQALYAQGRTGPGPIVTNADGILHKSNHQAASDGLGHAVDCCFQGSDPFGEKQPWKLYGACVEATGLHWGGSPDFLTKGINDRPHAEMR
jgi:peptidoglycan LD-endopeptidase CwlK